ncbi:MAG TPA: hypothetical protein VH639_07565 [Bryobacteraceae bacterium]|jgi:hypothetical protein
MRIAQRFASSLFLGAAALALSAVAVGQGTPPSFQLLTTITVPGGLGGYDINWIDPGTQRYYLADRTATKGTGRIDVVDTDTMKFLYSIPSTPNEIAFSGTVPSKTPGCSLSGPNGVVAVPQMRQLYVGDGDSTVKVVDLDARAVVAIIHTGGNCRADELAYDPLDHIVAIANDQDSPPFVTFISTDTQTVLGRYTYPASQVGFGLEQPAWDAKAKRFYISVPASTNSAGSVDVINPITMTVEKSLQTQCSPAGLVLTPSQHLITSCGQVFDAASGNSLGVTLGVAGDQIWYNPGDNNTYFGFFVGTFGPTVGVGVSVVDANTNQFLTAIPASTHSLAVDPNNNRIFVPVSGKGIQVYAQQ